MRMFSRAHLLLPGGPMTAINYRTAKVDGLKIFYREAGRPKAPALLLMHGFPSAGHMFRDVGPNV